MEETGQTVQETPKVQAEQTGENGKNVGMPECETMELIMESRSENEEFARVVAAVFASRLDPTLEELDDIKTGDRKGRSIFRRRHGKRSGCFL